MFKIKQLIVFMGVLFISSHLEGAAAQASNSQIRNISIVNATGRRASVALSLIGTPSKKSLLNESDLYEKLEVGQLTERMLTNDVDKIRFTSIGKAIVPDDILVKDLPSGNSTIIYKQPEENRVTHEIMPGVYAFLFGPKWESNNTIMLTNATGKEISLNISRGMDRHPSYFRDIPSGGSILSDRSLFSLNVVDDPLNLKSDDIFFSVLPFSESGMTIVFKLNPEKNKIIYEFQGDQEAIKGAVEAQNAEHAWRNAAAARWAIPAAAGGPAALSAEDRLRNELKESREELARTKAKLAEYEPGA